MKEAIDYLKRKLDAFPRVPMSLLPTPCHRLNAISEMYGVEVFCKRDDLTGFGFGGNKTRKLDLLLAEALDYECDTIVTSGGIQSNFCRITAAAGIYRGLSVHLVLGGQAPETLTGNLVLDEILGATTHFVEAAGFKDLEEESKRVARELESQGRKVFRIPVGGSVPMGAMAYTMAFTEILDDQERLGITFDHIIHASESGGTQAGLITGKLATGWRGNITGISAGTDRATLEEKIAVLANETAHLLEGRAERDAVVVDDAYIGEGYAIPTCAGERAVRLFAEKEGIFLDHVYTGKAASGLLDWLEKGRLKGQRVLFLHTGGTPELFA
ncbi:MAG: D-cysteine desulfhydrase family protein [Deltaproteobacteria bacterium]|nr:D-cysteine desulfhydrase family protein [Deltaproteobacteria bacterium]